MKKNTTAHFERRSGIRKENAVRHCINDILQGATYSVLKQHLMEDDYGLGYNYANSQSERIIYEARDRIKKDFQEQLPSMREDMVSRLLDVYTESRDSYNSLAALKALDQLAKLSGLYEQKVNVKADVNQDININFGFDDKDDKE